MGYTHYWRVAKISHVRIVDKWPQIQEAVQRILDKYKDIVQYEYDVEELALCGDGKIHFNGIDEDGHETFHFSYSARDFNFCKTARKPYDIVVCCVLGILKAHLPGLEVSSDGHEEWDDARDVLRNFGYHIDFEDERLTAKRVASEPEKNTYLLKIYLKTDSDPDNVDMLLGDVAEHISDVGDSYDVDTSDCTYEVSKSFNTQTFEEK